MLDTDILGKRLVMATALSAVLEVSWDILDLIQQIASGFSDLDDGWAFTQAGAAARRGCYALNVAHSLPDDRCDDELPMCVFDGQGQAARALAALAGLVRLKLTQACCQATDQDDLRVLGP